MSPGFVIGALLALLTQAGGPAIPDAARLARVDTAGSTTAVGRGKPGKLVLNVVPTGTKDAPTHLETAFPVRVTLTAPPGLSIAKGVLTKADASLVDRKKGLRFEVPLRAEAAGQHELRARVKFAVCVEDPATSETRVCLPQDREVALRVSAR
jgi:hypothetical protein